VNVGNLDMLLHIDSETLYAVLMEVSDGLADEPQPRDGHAH
jgi:hypothetical protein